MLYNETAVEQTKSAISQMKLFHSSKDSKDFEVITNFEKACFNAFERENYKGTVGEESLTDMTWNDFRENVFAEVTEKIYENPDYREISKAIMEIDVPEIDSIEYSEEAEEVSDEISADLELCVKCRATVGFENEFFEAVFRAYEAGGWPCGWKGEFPQGKLIVYFPKK